MHVQHIQATGFKGTSFTHDLTRLTIITGANFAGKTSRLAAIQLALLGYIPGEPPKKTNAAIMDFALSTAIAVKATLNDGTSYLRRFWEEKGAMRSEGSKDVLDVPVLDMARFFKMGPTEQLAYAFSRVELPADYTVDAILAGVKAIKVEEPTEETEAALGAVSTKVRAVLAANGVNVGLAELVKDKGELRQIITYQKRRDKETMGHVRTAMELRTREGECSAETLATIDTELTAAKAKLSEVTTRKGALDQRSAAASRTNTRRTELKRELDAKGRDFASELTTKDIELRTARSPITAPPDGTVEDLKARAEAATNLRAGLSADGKAAAERVIKAQKALAEIDLWECCPTCKGNAPGFKATLVETYTTERDAAKAIVDDLTIRYPVALDNEAKTKAALRALLEYNDAVREREVTIERLERAIANLEQQKQAAQDLRLAKAAELAGLEEATGPTEEEAEACLQDFMAATDTVEEIEARRDTAVALAQEIKRAAEAARDNDIARATLLVAEAVMESLKGTQAKMIEQGIGGTLRTANLIVGSILPTELAFHAGELGRWKDSRFIKLATFSGTEEALAYVGLSAALSSTASLKIAMIDEFDRLDADSQDKALVRLEEAVQDGLLDQVIISAPRIPVFDSNAWLHIAL